MAVDHDPLEYLVPKNTWFRMTGMILLGAVLAEIVAYVFCWTLFAGLPDVRDTITQHVALCVLGTIVALLLSHFPSANGKTFQTVRRRTVITMLATYLFMVVFLGLTETFVLEAQVWATFWWCVLIVAPICCLLVGSLEVALAMYPPKKAVSKWGRIVVGLAICQALLRNVGSITLAIAVICLLWVIIILHGKVLGGLMKRDLADLSVRPSHGENAIADELSGLLQWAVKKRTNDELWILLLKGAAIVVLAEFVLGAFPLQWDIAKVVAFIFAISPVLSAENASVPTVIRDAQVGLSTTRKSITVFGAVGGRLLVFGWVAVLFISYNWTEPRLLDEPSEPIVVDLPEPAPLPPEALHAGVDPYSVFPGYRREWDRHNHRWMENTRKLSEYKDELEYVKVWNAGVADDVKMRRRVKWMAWLAVLLASGAYVVRVAKQKQGVQQFSFSEALPLPSATKSELESIG